MFSLRGSKKETATRGKLPTRRDRKVEGGRALVPLSSSGAFPLVSGKAFSKKLQS
jgi:hypothetical protein